MCFGVLLNVSVNVPELEISTCVESWLCLNKYCFSQMPLKQESVENLKLGFVFCS